MFPRLDNLPLPLQLALDPVIAVILIICLLGLLIKLFPPIYWILRRLGRLSSIIFWLTILIVAALWRLIRPKLKDIQTVRRRKRIRSFNAVCSNYIETITNDAEKIISFAQVCYASETLIWRAPVDSRGIHSLLIFMQYEHLTQLLKLLDLPKSVTQEGLKVLQYRFQEDLERSRATDYPRSSTRTRS